MLVFAQNRGAVCAAEDPKARPGETSFVVGAETRGHAVREKEGIQKRKDPKKAGTQKKKRRRGSPRGTLSKNGADGWQGPKRKGKKEEKSKNGWSSPRGEGREENRVVLLKKQADGTKA